MAYLVNENGEFVKVEEKKIKELSSINKLDKRIAELEEEKEALSLKVSELEAIISTKEGKVK